MRSMFRLFGVLLVVFVFGVAGINSAWSDTINCTRTSNQLQGLKKSKFESLFPKQLSLNTKGWSKVSGQKSLRKGEYQLLPNGKMIFTNLGAGCLSSGGGDCVARHLNIPSVAYRCNKTALEISKGKSGVVASMAPPDYFDEFPISFKNDKTGSIFKVSEDGKSFFIAMNENNYFKKVTEIVRDGSKLKVSLNLNNANKCSCVTPNFRNPVDA